MGSIWTMGELLVEVMRTESDVGLKSAEVFRGPFPSGAPAIFIDTVARLGVSAGIYGGVADDAFGACLTERLLGDGVDCTNVSTFDGATAVAFVAYASDGSRQFLYHFSRTPAVMATFTPPVLAEPATFFHVMGCSLMADSRFREEIVKAATWFGESGARISFDPNVRPELLGSDSLDLIVGPILRQTSVLLPGLPELALLSGLDDENRAVEALFAQYGLELIVVKKGKSGATIHHRGGEGGGDRPNPIDVPAFPVAEVDPTGAGDCFDAGFLAGLATGKTPTVAAAIGAKAGAANAAAFGPMEGIITPEVMSTTGNG